MAGSELAKIRIAQRITGGLCIWCGVNQSRPGKQACQMCADKIAEKDQLRHARYRIEHKCWYCGIIMDKDRIAGCCQPCADKKNVHNKLIRAEYKELHRCRDCGVNLDDTIVGVFCQECAHKYATRHKDIRILLKQQVIDYYGGKCICCGESQIEKLTIDHINGDGKQHRNDNPDFYVKIVQDNYPSHLQCLCWNCNNGRAINGGICPHKRHSNNSTKRQELKKETFSHYTDGTCAICGEAELIFLTIDHVWGRHGPYKEGYLTGTSLYNNLRKRNYPQDGYRCLCFNDNCSHINDNF